MANVNSIIEAISKLDPAKVQAAGSAAELQDILKAEGVTATSEEIEAALTELAKASGKTEVSEESLDQVAGGVPPVVVPLITELGKEIVKKVIGGKDDKKKDAPAGGGSGLTQNNSGNKGAQQNSQTGNNTNSQGMTVNVGK